MKRPPGFREFVALILLNGTLGFGAQTNLVSNGSFEQSERRAWAPDGWSAAGNAAVKQQLLLDTGRDGRRCAKLVCSEFQGDGPDHHAMICQVGKVGLRRGQWYRLAFWAKAEGLRAGSVEVALSNTRLWENAGLSGAFTPGSQWQEFKFLFRAREDLPPGESRLQFWFNSIGTLWLDDVVLAESAEGQQWFPQIATDGVKNFVPNSSFECGTANWGSFTYGLSGWAGNLYRLEGEADETTAYHGGHSLKICLRRGSLPVFYFDYYDPVRQPVRRVLAANEGWFRVKPGEKLTLSAWLKGDAEGIAGQMIANEASNRQLRKQVTVGKEWRRCEFTFTPTQPFLFIAVGLDLEASKAEAATLWLDGIQLERGDQATAYEPRQPVEAFIESAAVGHKANNKGTKAQSGVEPVEANVTGNIFTNPATGLAFTIRAFNDTEQKQALRGNLQVTDFFDRPVFAKGCDIQVPGRTGTNVILSGLCRGREGYFRAAWKGGSTTQFVRCAVITPAGAGLADSPLGFNHAYPWDYLVRSAQQAGLVWWRDWSAKWQTVEPEKGKFDFAIPDIQIRRVLGLNSQVEVLLPFASASWCTTADAAAVEKWARGSEELKKRLPAAYAPKDLDDFGRYAAEVARHYVESRPRPVTHFQILNEPLYTDYSLPRRFGYTLADYLRLLEVAGRSIHRVDPRCRVVGGISANVNAGLTREFVVQGGLQLLDVLDLHLYDAARPAESFEESFAALESLMGAHGGPKPVWITEWGCYADDDPACLPQRVGDETMNRCCWPSERAATEHIVKFTAVAFAHGVRKIFFHAGTCGSINGPDAGGVLFEYGGAPRKMYAGAAALTRLLGVPEACLKQTHTSGLHVCVFRTQGRAVAIAWCEPGQTRTLKPGRGVAAYDIMGNILPRGRAILEQSPVYFVGDKADAVFEAVVGNGP